MIPEYATRGSIASKIIIIIPNPVQSKSFLNPRKLKGFNVAIHPTNNEGTIKIPMDCVICINFSNAMFSGLEGSIEFIASRSGMSKNIRAPIRLIRVKIKKLTKAITANRISCIYGRSPPKKRFSMPQK